jgi:signal transduction histidine kinase/PAS domain-containing protein
MSNEFEGLIPVPSMDATVQVLLVTAASTPPLCWLGEDGSHLELRRVGDVDSAMRLLDSERIDVVVLDGGTAVDPAELDRLHGNLNGAGLLILGDDFTPDSVPVVQRLGGAACLLPASASPVVQSEVVRMAAERARLEAALRQRVGELEERTRELERSRTRFQDVIERNADAILVVDREGEIRFANSMAAVLFRSDRAALIGTPFGFPVLLGEATELDLPDNGSSRVVEMRVVESEWEGEPAFIASLRDITDRKRAEEDARNLIREQAARGAAEVAAARFRFLAEASTLLALPLDDGETLTTLARLCVSDIADWAVVYLLNDEGVLERIEVAHREPELAEAAAALRESPIETNSAHPAHEVLRTGEPLLMRHVTPADLERMTANAPHLALARRLGVESLMIVPLVARDRGLGAIALISASPDRRFDEEDLAVARDLGLRAALAVDNARLFREAQEANRGKSDLLAVISHDLRTPLNAIMGYSELLSMGIGGALTSTGQQHVERVRMSAMHLLYLIDELLSFARLEAGQQQIRLQDVDACAIVEEVTAVLEPLAGERGLNLRVEADGPVVLRTDPARLRQVLLNLVGNAIKYTPQGEVCLEARTGAGGAAEFRIRDTGVGIASEHLPRIFEPFWQVDSSERARHGGTGLGLSVVRRLVHLLAGSIDVESEVGRGSVFTVSLPESPPGEAPAPPTPDGLAQNGG